MNKTARIILAVIATIAALYFSLFTFYSTSVNTKFSTEKCFFSFLAPPDDPCNIDNPSFTGNTTKKTTEFKPVNTINLIVLPLIALVYLVVIWLLFTVGHHHFRSLTAGLVLIAAATILISPLSIAYVKENNKFKAIEKAKAAAEVQAKEATEKFLSKPLYFNPEVIDINGKFDLDKCIRIGMSGRECFSSTPF